MHIPSIKALRTLIAAGTNAVSQTTGREYKDSGDDRRLDDIGRFTQDGKVEDK